MSNPLNFKDTPIQRKLMGVIMLTCAAVLSLMCAAYILLEYISFRENLKSNVKTLGSVIASNSSAALAFLSVKDAHEILNALNAEPHIVAACLYDESGEIFAKYPKDSPDSIFPSSPSRVGRYEFAESSLEGFQPVMQNNQVLGTLFIRTDLIAMYDQLRYYVIVGLIFITCSLFIAYLLSEILQKSISEPIIALEDTAKQISMKHDYSVRAKKFGEDEVGSLTDTFNFMLTQIQTQNAEIIKLNQGLEEKVKSRTLALQQQKDFVETIINSSVDLVTVFDTKLNYMMLNKQFDAVFPIKRESVIGKNLLDVFPEAKNSIGFEKLQRAIKGETVHDINYHSFLLNKTLETFYIPLKDSEDSVYGVLVIAHDVTQVMESNAKLETLNAELIKSNRDLEQFAYIASHDLQEPLRKIQTFAQLLESSVNDPNKLIHFNEKIKQSANRMQNLIQDVLNFSRISNSGDAFVDVDLNEIIENLKSDFELILHEKEAIIKHPTLPVIKGIPLQLSQLFSNLISNALKYNDKKPVISIHCDYISPEELKNYPKLNPQKKYLLLQFQDNGIGFEPQFTEKIFNIFQRLHGRQSYYGTGIGLALCKKIAENHQGIIFATSEPEVGSNFSVILPDSLETT